MRWDISTATFSTSTPIGAVWNRSTKHRNDNVILCTGCNKPITCSGDPGTHPVTCSSCGKRMNVANIEPAEQRTGAFGFLSA